MKKPKIECDTCFWFKHDETAPWCDYHHHRIEELEPCNEYAEDTEFCTEHDIYVGSGGKARVMPNEGEEEYLKRRET